MKLNNNWKLNNDTNTWISGREVLNNSDFQSLKEDFESYRLFRKCLSGSTYIDLKRLESGSPQSTDFDNIYPILEEFGERGSWYYDSIGQSPIPYIQSPGQLPERPIPITNLEDLDNFTKGVVKDYNFTLKNSFTPDTLIEDQYRNIYYVDLATTQRIEDIGITFDQLRIDGILVREGHRVLIKDQFDLVTLDITQNPNQFFKGHFEINETIGQNVTYRVTNSQNGIYIFSQNRLIRETDLDTYGGSWKYSISPKLGELNREVEFELVRLSNGLYPDWTSGELYPNGPVGEPIWFRQTKSWVLRHRVDYNNLYELSLKSGLTSPTQSIDIIKNIGTQSLNFTYSIPQREISIGEFGSIIIKQDGFTNFVPNKWKEGLKSISETPRYYWVCGETGTLLKIDKINLVIERVTIGKIQTEFNGVSFWNEFRGVLVGKFNQIWWTDNGGLDWNRIQFPDFDGFNYNSVEFVSPSRFYVIGDNGVFIEFNLNLNNWNAIKRRISKYLNGIEDEFLLVDNILDLDYFSFGGSDYVALSCESGGLVIYDVGGAILPQVGFFFLEDLTFGNIGDINSVTWDSLNNNLIFSTQNNIWTTNPFSGTPPTTTQNISETTWTQIPLQDDISINHIWISNGNIISVGNFSSWKEIEFNGNLMDVWDSTFFSQRIKPGLLFLNYDIASKVYWFDDDGNYRLPNPYGITVSNIIGQGAQFEFGRNIKTIFGSTGSISIPEENWITYFSDSQKTFAYHTGLDQSNIVKPSFKFKFSGELGTTFSYGTQSMGLEYSDVIGLIPNATDSGFPISPDNSRFRDSGNPIITPNNSKNLYFWDYLGIWSEVFSGGILPEVGDVLEITSDVFRGNFIINRGITQSTTISPGASARLTFTMPTIVGIQPIPNVSNITISYGTDSLHPSLPGGITASTSITTDFRSDIIAAINADTPITGFSDLPVGSNSVRIFSPIGSQFNGNFVQIGGNYLVTSMIAFVDGTDPIIETRGWFYFWTDFNGDILNRISQTNGISIRNLNKYSSTEYLIDNLDRHYLGGGYSFKEVDNTIQISGKLSPESAYYNLQTKIEIVTPTLTQLEHTMEYPVGFLNFGYSPTYNILNYLNFLNPDVWRPDREFLSMPNWINIPSGPNSGQPLIDSIWIDPGLETNKLKFGKNLKYIWDTLLLNVFIDVRLGFVGGTTQLTESLLIIKKYFDGEYYIIEFHDSILSDITFPRSPANPFYGLISQISLFSRRRLDQISGDLQKLNNIHRPNDLVSNSWGTIPTLGVIGGTWDNFGTKIRSKFSTDSYSKLILCDSRLVDDISGLIYIDDKSELSIQITKTQRRNRLNPVAVTSTILDNKFSITFSQKHGLRTGDWIVIRPIGQVNNSSILGYKPVNVINNFTISIDVQFVSGTLPSSLSIEVYRGDYFLNYQPIDLFGIGIGDKKVKRSIKIEPSNIQSDITTSLIGVDINRFRFKLVDGLDLETINSQYQWLLEGEISDAVIGTKSGELIWYSGTWRCGRWFGGRWLSGDWLSGDWHRGVWSSEESGQTNPSLSKWFGGRWFGGTWFGGTWFGGKWYGGEWKSGIWYRGTWNEGVWSGGEWKSGIWILGEWRGGLFNTSNGLSFWLDGLFLGGDFENGSWFNGIFKSDFTTSRFGTKSSNSRKSVWLGGKFLSGEFHSRLNQDNLGNNLVSQIHKFSIFYTGLFSGDFWGGTAYIMNSKSSIWMGGILLDGEVLEIDTNSNRIIVRGDWESFNIGDEFYIVDTDSQPTSIWGSLESPRRYKIFKTFYDETLDRTEILVDINLNQIGGPSGSVNNLRFVSGFDSTIWKSGVWRNGVFIGGNFITGVWYSGHFDGTWG
jgi:hypothetical protein